MLKFKSLLQLNRKDKNDDEILHFSVDKLGIIKHRLVQKILLLTFIFFTMCSLTYASDFPPLPKHGYIMDQAHMISAEDTTAINAIANQLYHEKNILLLTVTISSLANENANNTNIKQYTDELIAAWNIKPQYRGNVIMLLISKDDRKIQIELGNNLSPSLNNERQNIIYNGIIPDFKQGDFSAGILNGIKDLDLAVRKNDNSSPSSHQQVSNTKTAVTNPNTPIQGDLVSHPNENFSTKIHRLLPLSILLIPVLFYLIIIGFAYFMIRRGHKTIGYFILGWLLFKSYRSYSNNYYQNNTEVNIQDNNNDNNSGTGSW